LKSEKSIQNEILRAFGTRPWLRIWRANAGVARFDGRTVRFGVPGQADLTGILPGGRRLEIEVKSDSGRQTKNQKNYENIINGRGGLYILARSVDDVATALSDYIQEVSDA